MWDNHTMAGGYVSAQAALGRRIAEARADNGVTQADLARAVGLERTAFVRIESGERKVSATELVAITGALGKPVDWFFTESPPAVVSRRRDPAVGGFSRRIDLALELVSRDAAFLTDREIVTCPDIAARKAPGSYKEAEQLACEVRAELDCPNGPLPDLQSAAESLGLLGFSFDLGPDAGDAAYAEVGDLGVAVINGATDPGRRRFSLAHELGHHLVGDAYEPAPRLGAGDTERMFQAFAAYLLMPRTAVLGLWEEFADQPVRRAAIAVAVRFSVSWTAACNQLRNLDLIDSRERERLVENALRKGELFEFGERFGIELEPPSIPPGYARSVVSAYRRKLLTAARTLELLHGTVREADLPEPDGPSLEDLREEFGPDL